MRFEASCEWKKCKLKELSKIFDGTHQTPDYKDHGISFVSVEDIDDLYSTSKFITKDAFYRDFKIYPQKNDILMTRIGDIGTPALVTKEQPLAYYVSLALIKPTINLNSTFAKYMIESKSFQHELWKKTIHVAFPKKINKEEIGECLCFAPNIDSQRKIGLFLSLIDERIEAQNKIIKDNKTFKNQLTEKLIYKNSDVIYIALSNYCCLKNGYSFKSDCYSENGEYSIVTIGNVQGERYLNLEGAKTINTLPNDIQKHQILQKGDILVSLTGNVGRVSIVNKDNCLLNQRVGLLSFIDSKHIEYIFQCLSSPRFEMEMTRKGQGAAQLNLGTNDVASYKIPMRKNNADLVAKLLKKIDEKIILEEQINNLLKKQKQFLLANLFI